MNSFQKLIREYVYSSNVCMAEFLAWKKVRKMDEDMSFEDVFETYIKAMIESDDDRFFVMKEGELYEYVIGNDGKLKAVEREVGIH